MSARNLLIELLVEELPPKALKGLGEAFATGLADALRRQGLVGEHSALTPFATPRRLAVHISAVLAVAPERSESLKLMPVAVGLTPAGEPTPALQKKLASLGVDASVLPQLQRRLDGKAEALFLERAVRGATLAEGLQTALDTTLPKLPIPKLMQYQLADGWSSVNFVRPAHGLVALHGADVVNVSALGLHAGRATLGHRFEAPVSPVMLGDADHYARQLEEQGAVVVSFATRRGEISRQLHAQAARAGLVPLDDAALLDEVTALVERPNVLLCEFEPEFLAVPQECLILTMKANQKYFPLLDAQGRLTNRFLVVSNISPADASRVVEGNQRVVRPRLADARFFFEQDRKRTLASRVDGLAKVVYHNQLGSLGERVQRVRAIAKAIGMELGGAALAQQADRAAELAKADLLTDMVGEFPELQGVMGGYYARHDGLADEIACAIEDHYKPRFAGDALPRNLVGIVVALADKLETLVGLFGIGQLPSGDRDPFALRRHALGVIRMLAERGSGLSLDGAVDLAVSTPTWPNAFSRLVRSADGNSAPLRDALLQFFRDRLAVASREQGFSAAEVEAVLADDRFWNVGAVARRLAAVREFAALPEATSLAAANKRVGNILSKSGGSSAAQDVDAQRLVEPAERALHVALLEVAPRSLAAFDAGDYTASLQALAVLKGPVDAFFDAVMVNAEDAALRANRLALLAQLHQAMNRVADLSRLAA